MKHGRNSGKKLMAVRILRHAFEIIHLTTGEVRAGAGAVCGMSPLSFSSTAVVVIAKLETCSNPHQHLLLYFSRF
jgi:hypothetical protein